MKCLYKQKNIDSQDIQENCVILQVIRKKNEKDISYSQFDNFQPWDEFRPKV